MKRREFLLAGTLPVVGSAWQSGGPAPLEEPHFPSRLHLFVWRNWELANTDGMAAVLGASQANVLACGASMGLPRKRSLSPDQLRRIYVTVIRQNWHVLPQRQIIELLGWTEERFRFTLKEDDFLDVKMGRVQPAYEELRWHEPDAGERARAARIAATVHELFGDAIQQRGEEAFAFVAALSSPRQVGDLPHNTSVKVQAGEVDLSRGWSIAAGRGESERLRVWLERTMGTRVRLSSGARPKQIRWKLSGDAGEQFTVSVSDAAIEVSGSERGLTQALYWMMDRMEEREAPVLGKGEFTRKAVWDPRFLYSYFALYGDPLMEADLDPFPDAYLERLARCGINGVWMQAVLNTLAPSQRFPEFGAGWETRLRNLNALVVRARRLGVKVYLYLNEPRAMPAEFFRSRPEIRGAHFQGLYSMCTSRPEVREWIADSLAHVVRHVPEIGGFFSITMSENHTNCFSHGGSWGVKAPNAGDCPRCAQRMSWDTLAELLTTFREGVRRNGGKAEVIAWDWGWPGEMTTRLIPLLPKDVRFQSISEWDQPVERGGVKTKVGEYSISVVGPGPRATRSWKLAQENGVSRMAKVQFNNTWEISAVPYIPVPNLILRHASQLREAGVQGIMASWTCGGFPSPNLAAAKAMCFDPAASPGEILTGLGRQRYGKAAAEHAVQAWQEFSAAFEQFPYGVAIYVIPTQHGPANLLRLKATRQPLGMILFPHDGYKSWCGAYPPQIVEQQFRKMAEGWERGLAAWAEVVKTASPAKRRTAEFDQDVALTCYHHFQSVANQVEFYRLRDAGTGAARMREIVNSEIDLARRQYAVAKRNSTIAYEASNHYYYRPLDLVEKTLNCRWLLETPGAR